jgi:DNA-3-methyladenine glycosylase II
MPNRLHSALPDGTSRELTPTLLREGVRSLVASDEDLARAFSCTGPPPLWGRRPGFSTLVRIVLEQQVSLGSARAMYDRLAARAGGVNARAVVRLGEEGLRTLGFTRQKAAYCHGLAVRVLDGRIDLRAIAAAPDDDGRRMLMAVPGLGPWSVDIYYLMALRRPDVWPRGDLALAVALGEVKNLAALPSAQEQERIARAWAPWRAVAARMLWKHYLSMRRAASR